MRTQRVKGSQCFKSVCSMISTGTERLVAGGKVGSFFNDKMSVPYQEGTFSFPIKYGYSLIVSGQEGRLGHLMHPHQDAVVIEGKNIYWFPVNLPSQRAALVSNMETVINAIWDAKPDKNQKIAVCGFGNIGSLLAMTLRLHHDIEVDVIEKNDWRIEKANDLGWTTNRKCNDYDLIFHTSATASGLQYCIDHLAEEGTIIELSWYGDNNICLSLGRAFHYNRLKLVSSQVSVIPKSMRNKYNYKTRKDLACKLLLHPEYDDLITRISFDDAIDFYDQLRTGHQPEGLIFIMKY